MERLSLKKAENLLGYGVSEATSRPASDWTVTGIARGGKTKQVSVVWIQKSYLADKKDSSDMEVFERDEFVEH